MQFRHLRPARSTCVAPIISSSITVHVYKYTQEHLRPQSARNSCNTCASRTSGPLHAEAQAAGRHAGASLDHVDHQYGRTPAGRAPPAHAVANPERSELQQQQPEEGQHEQPTKKRRLPVTVISGFLGEFKAAPSLASAGSHS